ncbi:MAG: dehydrogenase, partial [Pusillimonas sp.]|nr:dehydrogenase [Pusillimonas sp.]
MKRRGLRFAVLGMLALVVILGLAVLGGVFNKSAVSQQVKKPLSAEQMQLLLPRGKELALAGDCFGCHSQTQGPRGSGGVAIDTPFGALHSTNITPDPKYGIGNYTREDFHRVLRDGVAPGGRNLYPAMPYVFTHITRPDDIDALYAYFMSIEPMAVPNVPNTGVFQFPVRPFMSFWNLLNFPDRKPPNLADRSEQWVRGAYLVEGLGHCAACHTPQNFMMGTDFARPFKGGEIEGVRVPDITAKALSERGFNVATLSQYLSTGVAPQGTAYADMYTVVHFSTSA